MHALICLFVALMDVEGCSCLFVDLMCVLGCVESICLFVGWINACLGIHLFVCLLD